MLPTKKTKFALMLNTLFLLISIGVFVGGLYYVNDLQSQITSQEFELESEELFSSSLGGIKATLENSQYELGIFNSYFVSENQTIGYLDQVESLANKNDIELSITLGQELEPIDNAIAKLSRLSMNIATDGSLPNTIKFYRDLVLLDNLSVISEFTLTEKTSTETSEDGQPIVSSSPQWRSEVRLTVFQETL